MAQLPAEIFRLVINELHQQDKFECLQVCRKWNRLMETTDLFHTIHIGTARQLELLFEKVRKDPSLPNRISDLIFDASFNDEFDINRVHKYLPNIRALGLLANVPVVTAAESKTWNQLKHVAVDMDGIDNDHFFSHNICPNLTELVVSSRYHTPLSDSMRFLKEAPALTRLAASQFEFSISDLEILHRNLPLLASLSLTSTCTDVGDLPLSIVPAPTLSEVYIESSIDDRDCERAMLQYIRKKYTNVQKLGYRSDTEQVVSDEIPLIIKSLGSQLTELTLYTAFNTTKLVDALDTAHCRLKVLEVNTSKETLAAFARFTLFDCIEKLDLNLIGSSEHLNLDNLAHLSALRHLELGNQKEDKINISEILGLVGNQLASLRLYDAALEYDRVTDYPKFTLKKLSFSCVFIPTRLDHFISQSLPGLRDLTFEHCGFNYLHFLLPNINLCYLQIRDVKVGQTSKLLVKTLVNDEKRWYDAKPVFMAEEVNVPAYRSFSMYPPVRSLPFDAYKGFSSAYIECRSLDSVSLVFDN